MKVVEKIPLENGLEQWLIELEINGENWELSFVRELPNGGLSLRGLDGLKEEEAYGDWIDVELHEDLADEVEERVNDFVFHMKQ